MHGHGQRRWSGAGIVAFIVMIAFAACGGSEQAPRPAAPPAVVVTPAVEQTIPVYSDHVGQTEAVETVEIGTQVSGVVQELHADFNSIVKKGQVIARLDPQLIQTQIEQQSANVQRAEADLSRLEVAL